MTGGHHGGGRILSPAPDIITLLLFFFSKKMKSIQVLVALVLLATVALAQNSNNVNVTLHVMTICPGNWNPPPAAHTGLVAVGYISEIMASFGSFFVLFSFFLFFFVQMLPSVSRISWMFLTRWVPL